MSKEKLTNAGFGNTGPRSGYGQGNYVKNMPEVMTEKFNDFSGAIDISMATEDLPANVSRGMIDTEVSRDRRIIRAPGTSQAELLTGHTPTQIMLHAQLDGTSELLVVDGANLGVKRETSTQWFNAGLEGTSLYAHAVYGDNFIFMNGVGPVLSRQPRALTVQTEPNIPNGQSLAIFAARTVIGGAVIDGTYQPMGVVWGGVNGYNDFTDPTSGSGSQLLIGDMSDDDSNVAIKTIAFDYLAVLNRKSIWVGRRTGDLFNPIDFAPRVNGKGCIARDTAQSVQGGVMFLTDEGLELFNGNSCTHVSNQIDAEILPIDSANIRKYTASYNPITQRYILNVPNGKSYVLDILRGRWYRRSLQFLGCTPFGQQFAEQTWAMMTGTWGSYSSTTWASLSPKEVSIALNYFLGIDNNGNYALHYEDPASPTNFGVNTVPTWDSVMRAGPKNKMLVTTQKIRFTHIGTGSIDIYLPDINSQYVKVNITALGLPNIAVSNEVESASIYTGRELGVKFVIVSGSPQILGVELDYLQRSPRIEQAAFTPREYQADF